MCWGRNPSQEVPGPALKLLRPFCVFVNWAMACDVYSHEGRTHDTASADWCALRGKELLLSVEGLWFSLPSALSMPPGASFLHSIILRSPGQTARSRGRQERYALPRHNV